MSCDRGEAIVLAKGRNIERTRFTSLGILTSEGLKKEYSDEFLAFNEKEVRTAKLFLAMFFEPAKTFYTARGSYGLKHDAEDFGEKLGGEKVGLVSYVSNGAMIKAASELGIAQRRRIHDSPNTELKIKPKKNAHSIQGVFFEKSSI